MALTKRQNVSLLPSTRFLLTKTAPRVILGAVLFLFVATSFSFSMFQPEYNRQYFSLTTQSPHFKAYYPKREKAKIPEILSVAESSYTQITQIFPNKIPSINILVISSVKDCNKLFGRYHKTAKWITGQYNWNAITIINPRDKYRNKTIAHEMVHVFIWDISRNTPNWLNEGLAQYISKSNFNTNMKNNELDVAVRLHKLFSLAELNKPFDSFSTQHDVHLAYREAFSVTDFMIREFGLPKVVEFVLLRKQANELGDDIKQVFGLSYEAFEAQWLNSLKY